MALNDHRIVNYSNPVSSLPDHPSAEGITAAQLKAVFDSNANNEIKTSVNGIINNLLSKTINDSGADNIGSTVIPGVNGENVRAQLVALKNLIDAVVLGQIPDGTITDAKLSNAPGQVKEQIVNFAPHPSTLVTDTNGVHGLKIEEGDWTPTLYGVTTAGVNTYGKQVGLYRKSGKEVFITCLIALTTKDSAMAGAIRIGGLPFPTKNKADARFGFTISVIENFDLDSTRNHLGAFSLQNSNYISLLNYGDNVTLSSVAASQITNTTVIIISGTYLTD